MSANAELIAAFRAETEDLVKAVLLQYYFKDGSVPYADTAEVLSTIPVGLRAAYLTVNVAGIEYWFLPNGTLVNKQESLSIGDHSLALSKLVNIATLSFLGRSTAGTGTIEVLSVATVLQMLGLDGLSNDIGNKVDKVEGSSLVPDELILKIHDKFAEDEAAVIQSIIESIAAIASPDIPDKVLPYKISLPAGTDLALRIADAVEGTDYPTGWTLEAIGESGVSLKITHTLTGVEIESVTIKVLDDGTWQTLVNFKDAYSGVFEVDNVITIPGIYNALPLKIILRFA